jgi:hypothetical protein
MFLILIERFHFTNLFILEGAIRPCLLLLPGWKFDSVFAAVIRKG